MENKNNICYFYWCALGKAHLGGFLIRYEHTNEGGVLIPDQKSPLGELFLAHTSKAANIFQYPCVDDRITGWMVIIGYPFTTNYLVDDKRGFEFERSEDNHFTITFTTHTSQVDFLILEGYSLLLSFKKSCSFLFIWSILW